MPTREQLLQQAGVIQEYYNTEPRPEVMYKYWDEKTWMKCSEEPMWSINLQEYQIVETPEFVVDKPGIYKMRNGGFAHVDKIVDKRVSSLLPVKGYYTAGVITWTSEGKYNPGSEIEAEKDLVEYIGPAE